MVFSGESYQGSGDLVQAGPYVGGGGAAGMTAVGVTGVGPGHGMPVAAFHPGAGGVAQPVRTDLLGVYPGQLCADPRPEVVVAAVGPRPAVSGARAAAALVAAVA